MTTGILLLHAFPLDADMWDGQAEGLADVAPVVAVNLPGFGGAAQAAVAPMDWMDAAADEAEAALHGTGIDQVVVCGLSMGGYVAFSFLRRHPERVAGLVLANTKAGGDDGAGKQRRADLAARLRAEGSGFFVESPPPLLSAGASADLTKRVKTSIDRRHADSAGDNEADGGSGAGRNARRDRGRGPPLQPRGAGGVQPTPRGALPALHLVALST
jgi:pimeloyl-ACP methyl ester carboxylesterase